MKKSTAIIVIIAACLIGIVKCIISSYVFTAGVSLCVCSGFNWLLHHDDIIIDGYKVEECKEGYIIRSYVGPGGDVVIPSTLNGIKVVSINTGYANNVFGNCKNLTSVTIPDTVTNVGVFAFRDCSELVSVEIPDSVTRIKDNAFKNCMSLTSIEIPDSVTEIDGSFWYCKNLANVKLGSGVTEMPYAFKNCISLTSIELPDGVTDINGAFYGCTSLKRINILESVTQISDDTFEGCESIEVTYKGEIFDYEHLSDLYDAINGKKQPPQSEGGSYISSSDWEAPRHRACSHYRSTPVLVQTPLMRDIVSRLGVCLKTSCLAADFPHYFVKNSWST